MNKKPFVQVGRITSAHSLKGEVFVRLRAKSAAWLEQWQTLNLCRNGKHSEYSIIKKRAHKDGVIVQTREITDRTQAEKLVGSEVEIPASFLQSKPGEQIFLAEISGFVVFDQGKRLGPICGFASNGPQDLLKVKTAKGIYEVPLVKDFIQEIDYEKAEVHMILPEGLVDES